MKPAVCSAMFYARNFFRVWRFVKSRLAIKFMTLEVFKSEATNVVPAKMQHSHPPQVLWGVC